MADTGVDALDQTQTILNHMCSDVRPIPIDLHTACAIGLFDIVNESVDAKKNLDARNKAGWTPLMYAAYVGNDIIVNLLLEGGANPNLGTKEGTTPLMVAAGCGNANACYLLLQSYANINAQNSQGHTALMSAIRQGHQMVVQLLLEAGADIELREAATNRSGLMLAASEGDEIIVDILIACGAHVNNHDSEGHTARSLALHNNHMRTVTLLDSALDNLAATNVNNSMSTEGDLFSGAEEMNAYQKSIELKKAIESDLFLAVRECHVPGYRRNSEVPSQPRLALLRSAKSMPERDAPPHFGDCEDEPITTDPKGTLKTVEECCENPLVEIATLLDGLDLLKYLPLFEQLPAMEMGEFLNLTEEDLKTMGITLWGPRRKISNAMASLRQQKERDRANRKPPSSLELKKQHSTEQDGEEDSRAATPLANHQAYQEAITTINNLNMKVAQEYQLRKAAEGHLMEVQRYRQRCQTISTGLEMSHKDSIHHTSTLRVTHSMVCQQLDGLKQQTASGVKDLARLQRMWADVASLVTKMNLEFEALTRAQSQTSEEIKALDCHLKSP